MWKKIAYVSVLALTSNVGFAYLSTAETNAPALPPIHIERTLTLKSGETLSQTLHRAGFTNQKSLAISHPLQKKVKLNRLRPGDAITINYTEANGRADTFTSMQFIAPKDKIAKVENVNGEFIAKVVKRQLDTRRAVAVGEINGSLYTSARKASLPAALVPSFANLFAYELDFTRDIQPGDAFRVVYEEIRDEKGQYVRSGNILAAELVARKKTRSAYRFKDKYGQTDYYDAAGTPKRKLLLRTPLEFTRISSHFNPNRKHPILGYTKAHKGTDFAAPTGTPVKAAGSGTIERANRFGGYGNYIKIRHNSKYKTAYAHLHKFARGIRAGKRVKQGQIIGYVGTTGRSSGPHLHYEVHVNNRAVNALKAKLPAGNPLTKGQKSSFQRMVADVKSLWANAETRLAKLASQQADS